MNNAYQTMSAEWYDNLWAAEWMDYSTYGPTRRHVRKIMHTLIAPLHFDSILDIGCGEGSFLKEVVALRPNIQVIGTDVSPKAIELARKQVPQGRYEFLDVEHHALDLQADLTICCEVLEHIEDDHTAIANLAKMTRRYLVTVVPQGRMRGFERGDVGHVRNYTRELLSERLVAGGFQPLAVVEWGFPFFSPLYRDFLDRMPNNTVKGRMDWRKHLVATLLYKLFELNSWDKGDKLVILAERSA
ncbi:MAG: class I SAM-dependent methyltransferase [Oscillochloris sp.]|nr:class I SAM-dependent methyltransferase [Oscillochloris sp.]